MNILITIQKEEYKFKKNKFAGLDINANSLENVDFIIHLPISIISNNSKIIFKREKN